MACVTVSVAITLPKLESMEKKTEVELEFSNPECQIPKRNPIKHDLSVQEKALADSMY